MIGNYCGNGITKCCAVLINGRVSGIPVPPRNFFGLVSPIKWDVCEKKFPDGEGGGKNLSLTVSCHEFVRLDDIRTTRLIPPSEKTKQSIFNWIDTC